MHAGEGFRARGLMVVERNWLDVYPWANWGGNANLPEFQDGQEFTPSELTLKEVRGRGPVCLHVFCLPATWLAPMPGSLCLGVCGLYWPRLCLTLPEHPA